MAESFVAGNASTLSESVMQNVKHYFGELKGSQPVELHKLVIEEVEGPLFEIVMEHARYNQSRAAKMLGISRGTLRVKLRKYFGDKYVGTREQILVDEHDEVTQE